MIDRLPLPSVPPPPPKLQLPGHGSWRIWQDPPPWVGQSVYNVTHVLLLLAVLLLASAGDKTLEPTSTIAVSEIIMVNKWNVDRHTWQRWIGQESVPVTHQKKKASVNTQSTTTCLIFPLDSSSETTQRIKIHLKNIHCFVMFPDRVLFRTHFCYQKHFNSCRAVHSEKLKWLFSQFTFSNKMLKMHFCSQGSHWLILG